MANKKSKKIIKSVSYLDSEMLAFQGLAFKIKYIIYPTDVFDSDNPHTVKRKKDFIEFYESIDNETKNQIEALLNLVKKDVKVKGKVNEDKKGFFCLFKFETNTERYQIKIYAPWWVIRMIMPDYFEGAWFLPGFSLAELYQEACK